MPIKLGFKDVIFVMEDVDAASKVTPYPSVRGSPTLVLGVGLVMEDVDAASKAISTRVVSMLCG